MRQSGLLSLALLVFVGCSNSLGITSPREIEANLVGDWAESGDAPGHLYSTLTLTVSDTVVQGTGYLDDGGITEENLVVTGYVSGSQIVLRLAENGKTFLYQAQMVSDHVLSGEFVDGGVHVAANYEHFIATHPHPI